MPAAPMPGDEVSRRAALDGCNILDTAPEEVFDTLTREARELCEAPVALVSLVDADRQWFKSHSGTDVTQTPRDHSFCSYVVFTQSTIIIEDATHDPRVCDSPLVTGAPFVRAYAGVPLTIADNLTVGTLCVLDMKPRSFTTDQLVGLEQLAKQVVTQLELRTQVAIYRRSVVAAMMQLCQARGCAPIGAVNMVA